MKRTDQERIERELRRREKHARVGSRREDRADSEGEKRNPSAFIRDLHALLHFDEHQIYNTQDDEDVLELLINLKDELAEKHWDNVLRGAIRKTKVAEKDVAFTELKSLLLEC